MSYEGHEEHLCANGHRFTAGAFDDGPRTCECGAPSVWCNHVDDTNCDAVGHIPETAWTPLQLTPEVVETCNLGHKHVTAKATYRVPTPDELRLMQHFWDGSKSVPLDKASR